MRDNTLRQSSHRKGGISGLRMLVRPTTSIWLVILLLITTFSGIYYVQKTLLEIEEGLPIARAN